MRAKALSSAEVREVFEIDEDGVFWRRAFTSKNGRDHVRAKVVFKFRKDNYAQLQINDKLHFVHRIVYAYFKEDLGPDDIVDHIDGNRLNNSISNLRKVTKRQNNCNTYKNRNGRLPGCCYHKHAKKWLATIQIGRYQKYLGLYETEQEAHDAYLKAVQQLEG